MYYTLETSHLEEFRTVHTQEQLAGPCLSPASRDEATTVQGCNSLPSTVANDVGQPGKEDMGHKRMLEDTTVGPADLDQTDCPVPGGFVLPTIVADDHASPRHVVGAWTIVVIMIAIIYGTWNPAHRVN